jgi:high-affinity iron transporter
VTSVGTVAFVVWRESVEALLVVGVLNAWLVRQGDTARRGRRYLYGGIVAGLAGAALLGWALISLGDALSDTAQEIFQTTLVFIAAILIVQMVFWIRRRGRTLKKDLESALDGALERAHWWSVFALACIAVAREGSETVVFLAGTIAAAGHGGPIGAPALAAIAGLGLALLTYWLLQVGGRLISWRLFFSVTEVLLLFLAIALLLTGIDNLVDLGVLPELSRRLWDTSAVVPETGPIGGLLVSLFGYRAKPVLIEALTFALFWIGVTWALRRPAGVR